jgi:hypothetical protein
MFPGRDFAARARKIHWIESVLAVAALVSLLAVRNTAPEFSALNTTRNSIVNAPSHDLKPRFKCAAENWTVPVGSFLILPALTESLHLPLAPRFLFTLRTQGFRYNRPPPSV